MKKNEDATARVDALLNDTTHDDDAEQEAKEEAKRERARVARRARYARQKADEALLAPDGASRPKKVGAKNNNANPTGKGAMGRPNFLSIVRREAERRGVSLETMSYEVLAAMARQAKRGDVQAAKLVLDRLHGVQSTTPQVVVDQRSVSIGPPAPDTDGEVSDYIATMQRVAAQIDAANVGKAAICPPDTQGGVSSPTQDAQTPNQGVQVDEAQEDTEEDVHEVQLQEGAPQGQTLDDYMRDVAIPPVQEAPWPAGEALARAKRQAKEHNPFRQ